MLFLVAGMLLCACEDQPLRLDGNTRLVLRTTAVDRQGHPIENVMVSVSAHNEDDETAISSGHTKNDGTLEMAFFSPDDPNAVISFFFDAEEIEYVRSERTDVRIGDFRHYLLQLEPVVVFKQSEVVDIHFTYNQITEFAELTHVTSNALAPIPLSKNPLADFFSKPNVFTVAKNQTFTLIYAIYNPTTDGSTIAEVTITAGEDDLEYTLNY